MSEPDGKRLRRSRMALRRRLFTKLRPVASRTDFFGTIKPIRGGVSTSVRTWKATRFGLVKRTPLRIANRKSAALTKRLSRASKSLGRETLPTATTTSGNYGTAPAGSHAVTEPVLLSTATIVRLVSTLSHFFSCNISFPGQKPEPQVGHKTEFNLR